MEKKRKPKILASLKKAAFPASFADKDHQNRNFMVSNTMVVMLLLGKRFLNLESFSRGMRYGASFLAYAIWVHKNATPLAYAG